jgi:hypothetical protein
MGLHITLIHDSSSISMACLTRNYAALAAKPADTCIPPQRIIENRAGKTPPPAGTSAKAVETAGPDLAKGPTPY